MKNNLLLSDERMQVLTGAHRGHFPDPDAGGNAGHHPLPALLSRSGRSLLQ